MLNPSEIDGKSLGFNWMMLGLDVQRKRKPRDRPGRLSVPHGKTANPVGKGQVRLKIYFASALSMEVWFSKHCLRWLVESPGHRISPHVETASELALLNVGVSLSGS